MTHCFCKLNYIAAIFCVFAVSCQSSNRINEIQIDIAPLVVEGQVNAINELESRKAGIAEWQKLAICSKKITNRDTLKATLRGVSLMDADDLRIENAAMSEGQIWHFGFDSNFHALVFFPENSSSYVLTKW